jgi:hypothetical protein
VPGLWFRCALWRSANCSAYSDAGSTGFPADTVAAGKPGTSGAEALPSAPKSQLYDVGGLWKA